MTEIWVPYGPVEVSFDIKQENLSQVLEPQPAKFSPEDLEMIADLIAEENLLLLSGSPGIQKFLDVLLARNKGIKKILYLKAQGALARRKSQEFGIAAEQVDADKIEDLGMVDGIPSRIPLQLKNAGKVLVISSIHYDPIFGLSSSDFRFDLFNSRTKIPSFQDFLR